MIWIGPDEVGRTDVTTELKEDAARFREGVAATVDPRTEVGDDPGRPRVARTGIVGGDISRDRRSVGNCES